MFASLVVAALGALPFFTRGVAADQATCVRTYTVKAGDTCNAIGAAQRASTFQILASNPEINFGCTNLMPDQVICLGIQNADCTATYVVQPGDTCNGIETKNGINSTQLYHNNPNIDENCFNIYSGEVLCVAGNYIDYPAHPDFLKNETIATNQNPTPNTPYVAPITPQDDPWEIVKPEDVQDGEDLPYCDEVDA
jgi:hypothetical protein